MKLSNTQNWLKLIELLEIVVVVVTWLTWLDPRTSTVLFLLKLCFQSWAVWQQLRSLAKRRRAASRIKPK